MVHDTASMGDPATGARRVEAPTPVYDRISAGRFDEGASYATWRSRGTDDWLIIQTLGGRGRVGLPSGTSPDAVLLEPGDVVLLAPQTPHDYATAPGETRWALRFAHFHPRSEWLPLLEWPRLAPGVGRLRLRGEVEQRVGESLERAVLLSRGGLRLAPLFGLNALESALLWISTQLPAAPLDPRLITVLEIIDSRLHEPLDVRTLGAAVGLSGSRLAHLFRSELGAPPQRFVEQQRMRSAAQLLELTRRTVAEVARAVGYDDPLYFSGRFRRWSGLSPTTYRVAKTPAGGTGHDSTG